MASIYEHFYRAEDGKFIFTEIANLKETEKTFRKTNKTNGTYYSGWMVLRKEQLGKLEAEYGGDYVLYDTAKNEDRFKKLVIVAAESYKEIKKTEYEIAVNRQIAIRRAASSETEGSGQA